MHWDGLQAEVRWSLFLIGVAVDIRVLDESGSPRAARLAVHNQVGNPHTKSADALAAITESSLLRTPIHPGCRWMIALHYSPGSEWLIWGSGALYKAEIAPKKCPPTSKRNSLGVWWTRRATV